MEKNKKSFLEKIKVFFEKNKEKIKGSFPNRHDIKNAAASTRDNTLLRILIWSFLFFSIIALVVFFRSYANSNPEYLSIQAFFYSGATIFYLLLVFYFYEYLSDKLYALIVPKESKYDSETERNAGFLSVGIILCMTVMIFLLIFDYFQHSKVFGVTTPLVTEIQNNPEQSRIPQIHESPALEIPVFLGTYGDFFGGVVNPVLTFGTLIALAITILMQRLQLRDARHETKENLLHAQQQAFESTFFNLLALHTENVKNLRFEDDLSGKKLSEGRSVFASVLNHLAKDFEYAETRLIQYRLFQKNKNDILGHYFRNVYQILNHIENFKASMTLREKYIFQKRYANILRAQLSSHELVLLLLNCTKETVDDGRFRNLVVKYEFLEHLTATKGKDGVPFVHELGLSAEKIFLDYFPKDWEMKRNPHGAFGKNEVFKQYIEAKQAADTEQALNAMPSAPAESPRRVIE